MKAILASVADLPENLRSEYEEKNGQYVLKVEGDYPPLVEANTKLVEFRDNNRTLNTKVTQLSNDLKKFEGVDPAEYATLKTKVTELEKGGVKNKDDVATMIANAVKAAVTPLQETLAAQAASEKAAKQEVARKDLENQLRDAGLKVGIDERAVTDYVARGMKVFQHDENGKIVARKADGTPIFSAKKPADEITMEEWALGLQADAPFLFKPSKGGGAGGNNNNGNFTGTRRVISSDPVEFGLNLEAIAKGEAIVQD